MRGPSSQVSHVMSIIHCPPKGRVCFRFPKQAYGSVGCRVVEANDRHHEQCSCVFVCVTVSSIV